MKEKDILVCESRTFEPIKVVSGKESAGETYFRAVSLKTGKTLGFFKLCFHRRQRCFIRFENRAQCTEEKNNQFFNHTSKRS